MGNTPNVLQGARQALANAENFTHSVVRQAGGTSNAFRPSYQQARSQRRAAAETPAAPAKPETPREFMGIRSNEAPELNTALAAREDARKALE